MCSALEWTLAMALCVGVGGSSLVYSFYYF